MNDKWDVRFVELARHVAQWSKDPSTKCGAVIVDRHKKVLGMGFNGFAAATDDSPERYADKDAKYSGVIHSEENAILNSFTPLYDTEIYLSGMACDRCTSRLIQVGITKVVIPCKEEDPFSYRDDWEDSMNRAAAQFKSAGVWLRPLKPTGFDVTKLMGSKHPSPPICVNPGTNYEVDVGSAGELPEWWPDNHKLTGTVGGYLTKPQLDYVATCLRENAERGRLLRAVVDGWDNNARTNMAEIRQAIEAVRKHIQGSK
jgi:dCMP deaminase